MTFRDQAAADLSTFTNVDEFADTVEIDGVAVACVVEGNGDTSAPLDGVINRDTLYHFAADALDPLPKVGDRLTINAAQGDVIAISEDQGMVEMRVRWFDS